MKMKVLDTNTRKLNLIGRLLNVDDEAIFDQIETLLKKAGSPAYSMVQEEQIRYRITKAEKDIEDGNTLSQDEAERESENWKK
ncbi:MAG: hypothetical protein JKX84_02850 [Flavobacteriales bacterium]|nr:hypothetical protein [Flavobacteriales bacterium]